jgi:hypothetical protein
MAACMFSPLDDAVAMAPPSLSNILAFVTCPHNDSEQAAKQTRDTVSKIVERAATQSAALLERHSQLKRELS